MESVVVSVRLDERLVRAIDRAGRERSDVIREAIEEWLRRRYVGEMVREHAAGYRNSPVQAGEFDWLLEAAVWPDEEGARTVPVLPRRRPAGRAKTGRTKKPRNRG